VSDDRCIVCDISAERDGCAVRDLILAADRLRDRWAEGDKAVKQQLWRTLHTAADNAREALRVVGCQAPLPLPAGMPFEDAMTTNYGKETP
jgi:hypothetical protein